MRRPLLRNPACATLLVLGTACVPEAIPREPGPAAQTPPATNPSDPTTPDPVTNPGDPTLTSLTVDPGKTRIDVDALLTLVATAFDSEGAPQDVSADAAWQSSDPTVLVVVGPGQVRGLAPGSARVQVTLGDLTAQATVDVGEVVTEPVPVSLTVSPSQVELQEGNQATVAVTQTFDDGSAEDVTSAVTWASDDSAVANGQGATVTAIGPGATQLRASYGDLTANLSVTVTAAQCNYPSGGSIQVGGTMPALSWQTAVAADGSVTPLVLEDVHCGRTASTPSVIIFVVGAGWCSACPSYIRNVNSQAADIEAAGGMIVWVEAEDSRNRPASSSYADSYITNLVGRDHGLRIGDADTLPNARALYNAPLLRVFPSAFVVRTSDMKIIVDQQSSRSILPYVRIAQNPNGDWSNPNQPPPSNNCGPNDEETYEPNDTPAQASTISPGTFSGGICNGAPDYFRVNLTGTWQLDLTFRHSVGDLDVYVWDEARDAALEINGNKVGSESYTDNESFTHSGPALVRVHGYNGASAPYTLTLSGN